MNGLSALPAVSDLGPLTDDPRKLALYEHDVFFLEAMMEFGLVAGRPWFPGLLDELDRHTFVLLKPDVAETSCEGVALDFFRANDFEILARHELRLDRILIRGLWQYNFVSDDPVRMRIIDALLTHGPSVAYLLRQSDPARSASAALCLLKGSAEPAHRTGDVLRNRLCCPNVFMSAVHVPDDSADMLREFALLLDRATRRSWFARICGLHEGGPDAIVLPSGGGRPRPPQPAASRQALASRIGPARFEQLVADMTLSGDERLALAAVERLLDLVKDDPDDRWAAIVTLMYIFTGPLPIGSDISNMVPIYPCVA